MSTHCHIRPKTYFSLTIKLHYSTLPATAKNFLAAARTHCLNGPNLRLTGTIYFPASEPTRCSKTLLAAARTLCHTKAYKLTLLVAANSKLAAARPVNFEGNSTFPPTQTSHNESCFVVNLNSTYLVLKAFLSCS